MANPQNVTELAAAINELSRAQLEELLPKLGYTWKNGAWFEPGADPDNWRPDFNDPEVLQALLDRCAEMAIEKYKAALKDG